MKNFEENKQEDSYSNEASPYLAPQSVQESDTSSQYSEATEAKVYLIGVSIFVILAYFISMNIVVMMNVPADFNAKTDVLGPGIQMKGMTMNGALWCVLGAALLMIIPFKKPLSLTSLQQKIGY
ncbi:MAG: hypothetical protein HRT88_15090, partial [Lentisphaeraceae bacterium]|nr:hypothetical protein [Lentisphaeraceae bacterium]